MISPTELLLLSLVIYIYKTPLLRFGIVVLLPLSSFFRYQRHHVTRQPHIRPLDKCFTKVLEEAHPSYHASRHYITSFFTCAHALSPPRTPRRESAVRAARTKARAQRRGVRAGARARKRAQNGAMAAVACAQNASSACAKRRQKPCENAKRRGETQKQCKARRCFCTRVRARGVAVTGGGGAAQRVQA